MKVINNMMGPVMLHNSARCRPGWIAARTTALCLQFDSPTLGPRFPIPRPIVLLLGRVASHRVTSHHIGLHHSTLGHVTAHWVVSLRVGLHHSTLGHITAHWVASQHVGLRHIASGRVTLHCVASHWVALHRIGLHCIASGCVASHWVRSVTLLSGCVALLSTLFGALSLPAVIPLLCTLFPTAPCEGLTFTYMFPYLAPVIAALGARP